VVPLTGSTSGAIGGITSSRCINEETFLLQKLVRAAFGDNNVDTCARVCHSPTGYGLKTTFGTSAGTQDFDSVEKADVILVTGANPADAHPAFASRMKKRLREGARLIVIDPRRVDLVRTPHVEASHHLPLRPGTNVALLNALAHVVVIEGLVAETFVRERCDPDAFAEWVGFIRRPENSPEAVAAIIGIPAGDIRAAARLYATGGNGAIYYGLGVTEHSQGTTAVTATGNLGRRGSGSTRCAVKQRPGLVRHGLLPGRAVGLPPYFGRRRARPLRARLGRAPRPRSGSAHP
jgi:formate dehydrogenase major subunit